MKKLYTLAFALLGSVAFAQSFNVTYTFADVTNANGPVDPTPVPTATGITFGSFQAVNPEVESAYNSSGGGRFSFNTQPLGATNNDNTNFTGAIDLNKYFEVTLTPGAGKSISLEKIGLRVQRSGTGVRNYAVRTSVDNFASNLGTAAIDPANENLSVLADNVFFFNLDGVTTGQNGSVINITSINNVAQPITVRFYGWNAEAAGGTFSIDDVNFVGEVSEGASVKDNNIAGLAVYPNPLTGSVLNITSNNAVEKSVAIFDVLGKEVLNATTVNNAVTVNLNAGVYIVKVTEEGKTATRKLVIK